MASKYPETEKFVRKYGSQVESEIEKRLTSAKKIASGKLYDSIRYEVKEQKGDFLLKFLMAEYGKYVDGGVKGTGKGLGKNKKTVNKTGRFSFSEAPSGNGSFLKSLKKWCSIKGIPKEAAYPIRRSIWRYGLAPTNFFTIPTTRRQKQLEEGIEKSMIKDIDNILQKELNKK